MYENEGTRLQDAWRWMRKRHWDETAKNRMRMGVRSYNEFASCVSVSRQHWVKGRSPIGTVTESDGGFRQIARDR